ncbi:hypothetical protein KYJ26_07180 [Bacillus sp. MCCB 382]|uniref:hypothetical protein n=1 Tax=Bacillus sp. MCCB 382 TaxID=2860197 RepID=UPI001C5A3CFC|nr:hypothetical protein [Bacillus sp. MCCB 382]
MHPITTTEITFSVIFVIVIFVLSLLTPSYIRKLCLIVSISLTALLLIFFAVRPFWIDYQVSKKTEQLNEYLEEKFPQQEWQVTQQEGRQYSPYHLIVEFKNEKGWYYTYSVEDEEKICQNVWTPPEGDFPDEGIHFENPCEE